MCMCAGLLTERMFTLCESRSENGDSPSLHLHRAINQYKTQHKACTICCNTVYTHTHHSLYCNTL